MDAGDSGEKRRTGVYYTPPYLARFLCRECLARVISSRLFLPIEDAEEFIESDDCSNVPASIRSRCADIDALLSDVTIIDPAVGNGVMLVTMLDEIVKAREKTSRCDGQEPRVGDLYQTAVMRSLHGTDIDAGAVEAARKDIINSSGTLPDGAVEILGAALASHVVAGNSLAELGKLTRPGIFDIVISNPPYLSYYGNAPARMIEAEKRSLLQTFELVDRSNQRINAMNLFIELGIKLLKDNGTLAYVVNKTLCVLPSYRKTRAYILSNSTINRVVVDIDPFDAIVDCATLCLSKTKPPPHYTLSWCSLKGLVSPASLASILSRHQVQIPVTQFSNHKQLEFTYSVHDPILEKMERAEHKLRDTLVINRGINIGGCSEHFLSDTARDERYGMIILDAKHVTHYSAWWDDSQGFFVFDQEKERMLRAKGKTLVLGDPNRYEGPRLFIPEASKGIRAAYIDTRLYSAYGILVGKSKHGREDELKIACALLNSRAISFYAIEREILRKGKKATPHAGVKGLAELPVPSFSPAARETLIELIDKILEQLRVSLVGCAHNKIPPEIISLMADIDRVVYDSFHLGACDVHSINDAVDSLFK